MRRLSLRTAILGALVLPLAAVCTAASPPPAVGTVAAVLNQVRIKSAGIAQPQAAVVGRRLYLTNLVQTGPRSHMQALLLDRSAFTVGPNSQVTIDRFVYDPAGASLTASIVKGAMRFMSGMRGGTGSRSIATPVATIGIRGTIVDTVVGENAIAIAASERDLRSTPGGDPNNASLIVLRGPGPRVRGNVVPGVVSVTGGGRTVVLDRPLTAVYVPGPGAQPIGPFTISLASQDRVNDLILPPIEEVPGEPRDDPYLRRREDNHGLPPIEVWRRPPGEEPDPRRRDDDPLSHVRPFLPDGPPEDQPPPAPVVP